MVFVTKIAPEGIIMNEKDTLETELQLRATAELQESVAADMEKEDGDLSSLLEEEENNEHDSESNE